MPEGDSVWRAARRLDDALRDRVLVGVDLRWSRMPEVTLHGRRTLEVVPRGKHLLHRVEGGWTIHSHLRMDGSWRVLPTASVTPRLARHPDIRAIVATDELACVGWKLGMLDLIRTEAEPTLVGHLGPDLLGPDWDENEALLRLQKRPQREVGAALLDQRNLAGLGTVWTAEPLHAQQVNPWTPVADISQQTLRSVLRSAREMLLGSITDRRHDMQVYGRVGRPCLWCGTTIRSESIGVPPADRTLAYCQVCQPPPRRGTAQATDVASGG